MNHDDAACLPGPVRLRHQQGFKLFLGHHRRMPAIKIFSGLIFLSPGRGHHNTVRYFPRFTFDGNGRAEITAAAGQGGYLRFPVNGDQRLAFNLLNEVPDIFRRVGTVFRIMQGAGISA